MLVFYTDYPFEELGDKPNEEAPIRECRPISYDGDKYCEVEVDGAFGSIKAGYIYTAYGRYGEVAQFNPSDWF